MEWEFIYLSSYLDMGRPSLSVAGIGYLEDIGKGKLYDSTAMGKLHCMLIVC